MLMCMDVDVETIKRYFLCHLRIFFILILFLFVELMHLMCKNILKEFLQLRQLQSNVVDLIFTHHLTKNMLFKYILRTMER